MAFDPNNPLGSGLVLTFDDEFNSLSASSNGPANGAVWTQINGNPDLSVHNGVLDITSVQNGNGWTGGELISTNQQGQGFGQKFGYFEARIQCSVAGGSFVMFSQAHAQNGAAPATELDVLESDPGGHPTDILATLHQNSNGVPGADQTNLATGGNPFVDVGIPLAAGFHTYGALWDPNSPNITWYFDGRAVAVQPKFSDTDSAPMLLDIQAGIGLQQGAPQAAGETIPAVNHTYVDYVRAWQFSNENPVAAAPQAVSDPFGQAPSNGSTIPGESPIPSPAPAPLSSDGSTLAASAGGGQLVTSDGTWTFGGTTADGGNVIMLNGQAALNGAAVQLAVADGGHLFADNAQGVWYRWDGSVWTQTTDPLSTASDPPTSSNAGTPSPSPAPVSADGSTLTPGSGGQLVTADGAWAFGSATAGGGNVITLNGQPVLDGAAVQLVVADGGHLFADNAQGVWYEWSGSVWSQTTDPLATPAPSPAPAPAPAPPPVSADGSSLAPGSGGHLVTADGTWSFGSSTAGGGNLILLNGQAALDGAALQLVVADGGHLFADNAQGVWYEWSGSVWSQTTDPLATPAPSPAPAPAPAPPPVSADGSSLAPGSGGHLVTADGSWTFGSSTADGGNVILLNGKAALDGAAVQLVVADGGHVFADNAQGVWYEWNGSSWSQTTNPNIGTAPTVSATISPDGTTLTAGSGGHLATADGSWAFSSATTSGGNVITLNGHAALDGAAATLVVADGGHLFADNAQGVWYEWSGSSWTQTTDPLPATATTTLTAVTSTSSHAGLLSGTSSNLMAPTSVSGGHDLFVFSSLSQQGAEIANFSPSQDTIDLVPLLKAIGYSGTNPIGDHVVTIAPSGTDSTSILIDPTGHAANHGEVLVTLDHVLPQSLNASNFMH